MTGKSKVALKDIYLLKGIKKQYTKINIISYLCLITKAAERKRANSCFTALFRSICT